MNKKSGITNRVPQTENKSRGDIGCHAENVRARRVFSETCLTLFVVLFLFGTGLLIGCVGPASAQYSNCATQPSGSYPAYSAQNSIIRGQAPCQTCPTSTVSQCSGGMYKNSITVTCCNPTALWEAMIIPVRKYFPIKSEKPCRQIGDVVNPGKLNTDRTIGATVFEPWRGDSVGIRQRWEATLHTIARSAEIRVRLVDQNRYTIIVVVSKEIENAAHTNMSRNGQDNYFLSDSRRTFTDPLFSSENQKSDKWVYIGQDHLLEQRLLAEIEQSIRARCR